MESQVARAMNLRMFRNNKTPFIFMSLWSLHLSFVGTWPSIPDSITGRPLLVLTMASNPHRPMSRHPHRLPSSVHGSGKGCRLFITWKKGFAVDFSEQSQKDVATRQRHTYPSTPALALWCCHHRRSETTGQTGYRPAGRQALPGGQKPRVTCASTHTQGSRDTAQHMPFSSQCHKGSLGLCHQRAQGWKPRVISSWK